MSFDLLSEPIRKYIRDKRWEELRPIQNAAIAKILASSDNYILASRTASGKTEAAFLPILSKVNFDNFGVQVLYISPLIALINDQFYRVEELCKYLDVEVTKWHGEAKKSAKDNLLKNPSGIVLITPESLEAMFVNKPYNVTQLFSNLKYVVIDEIHSFIGSDRGTQLKSILSRMQDINVKHFSIVGLSATIGDFDQAKKFTGDVEHTTVLLDKTPKEIVAEFRYFKSGKEELPLELLKDLYLETHNKKVLIFPNNRGRAEEVAVKLLKISERVKGHSNYFSHHSSVDKEVREHIETFAKSNNHQNFCISCTSTLELGIDIGSVDEVVQIDSTHSIASLIQRVGRSGRKEGKKSNLILYTTREWSLLQSLACWLLYLEGFIEPPAINEKSFDILLHQALSITKGHSGIKQTELIQQLKSNFAFNEIAISDIEEIITHLIQIDFLEKIQNEVIIGIEGEKIVNSRDFYSVFKTEENFKVVCAGNIIGDMPFSSQTQENQNILLAAKIWKIKYVDLEAKKIEVVRALDGNKPAFSGGGGDIHPRIREKMFEILFNKINYEVLDTASLDEINKLRKDFSIFKVTNLKSERLLFVNEKKLILFSFTGTKINATIKFLLGLAGITNIIDDRSSSFELEITKNEFLKKWNTISYFLNNIDVHLENLLEASPNLIEFSKWGMFLPTKFKILLLKQKLFDFDNVKSILSCFLIENIEDNDAFNN